MRTDEYTDLRLEHYRVVTDRRVLVSGRSLANAAVAVRPPPWSPLAVGCALSRSDVSAAVRTRRGFNTARLRLDFSDRSWIVLAPWLGDRGGKVDRLVAALQPMRHQRGTAG